VSTKIYIDGTVHDPETAVVPVFDRGFLYGDSVYEVMRTAGGEPVDLGPHLARLRRSADAIALPAPPDELLTSAIRQTLAAAANDESYIRLMVTRGAGEIGLDVALADAPRTIVIVKPLSLPTAEMFERGVDLVTVSIERTSPRAVDPGVKSGNYLNNILALHEARKAGGYEAVMCDASGRIAEGSTSNLFVVRSGQITTPALEIGLLDGITRRRVIDLARGDGIAVDQGELTPAQARGADEAFITSSIRGVLPVRSIDGTALAAGAPGPITRKIMKLYEGYLAGHAPM
jgi:branched-chain amino acid aminotransferase